MSKIIKTMRLTLDIIKINPYNKPWRVEYETRDWRGNVLPNPYPKPYTVMTIRDCNSKIVVETDMGAYAPDAETAEYIVKCVNEREDS